MFKLEFKTGNAAFGDDDYETVTEVSRILSDVRERIANDEKSGKVRDINGNTVGSFELTDD